MKTMNQELRKKNKNCASKNLKIILAIIAFAFFASSCSKNEDTPTTIVTPTLPIQTKKFTSFYKLSNIVPTAAVIGIDYHSGTKNLYIETHPQDGSQGYNIIQINTETKLATTVYNSPITAGYGSTSRLRVIGNSIYVPMSNTSKLIRLVGLGTPTLTLANTITPPATGVTWVNAFDVALGNKLHLLDTSNRTIVTGDNPSFANLFSFSAIAGGQYQDSMVYASSNNVPYIITNTFGNLMSVYNPISGALIRSVQSPPNSNAPAFVCMLAKDSQGRVYNLTLDKLIRYSADLLTNEVFELSEQSGNYTGQFAIAEETDKISIYAITGQSVQNAGENFDIKTITIPK